MENQKNKAKRILTELTNYFFDENMANFSVKVQINEDYLKLKVEADIDKQPHNFEQFIQELNVPRQGDIDEYYKELLGGYNERQDYSLLGKSIDEARGEFKGHQLSVEIIRFH